VKTLAVKQCQSKISKALGRQIPISTVYSWIATDKLPARKIIGSWYVYPLDLENCIKDMKGEK
jgi:hypothetical protein